MATGKYSLDEWTSHAFVLGHRSKLGWKISLSKWHDLFHNRFYLGKTGWGRRGGGERDGNHTVLTDHATSDKVQEVLAKHDHYKKRTQRHEYLLSGLTYSLDADSPCLVTTQPSKHMSYYRNKTKVNGSQVYYNCQEIDEQASVVIKSLVIQPESRPQIQSALQEWLAEMGRTSEDSELSRARQRLDSLRTKRKNVNRCLRASMCKRARSSVMN